MDENNEQEKQNELDEASQKTAHVAGKGAATYFGGGLGGKAYDLASQTKVGQDIEKALGKSLQNNPISNKAMDAANKSGALDAADKGLDIVGGGENQGLSNPDEGLVDKSTNSELGGSSKSSDSNNLLSNKSSDNSNSDDNEEGETDVKTKGILEGVAANKSKIILISSGVSFFLFIAVILAGAGAVLGVIENAAAFVKRAWQGIGDFIDFFTLDGFLDDETKEEKFYEKLKSVQEEYNEEYGVCIDTNLITATLTAGMSLSDSLDSMDDEAGNNNDFARMQQYIEILAKMQIKTKRYSFKGCTSDSSPKVELITSGKKKSDLKSYVSIHDCDADSLFNYFCQASNILEKINNLFPFPSVITGLPSFTAKFDEGREHNYEYYNYSNPISKDDNGNPVLDINNNPTCSSDVPKDEYELDIGNYDTMEDSVYYWNLVYSFIPEYYKLDIVEDLFLDDGTPSEAIKEMAENIYMAWEEIGPEHSCGEDLCIDFDYGSNLCPNGIEVVEKDGTSNLIPFEKYVAGVVKAENNWHDGDNMESMKAQAIAARSYALSKTQNCKNSIKNGQTDQVYKDPTDDTYAQKAAQETKGIVITQNGTIMFTEYDSFCPIDNSGDYYTLSQKNQKIPKSYVDSQSGIKWTAKNCLCNQRSTADIKCFKNENRDGTYLRGGHGRGMSQYGSRYLQTQGYTYEQILKYYYGDDIEIAATEDEEGNGGIHVCTSGGISPNGSFVPHTCDDGLGLTEGATGSFWLTTPNYRTLTSSTNLNDFNKPQCTWYSYGRAMLALHEATGMAPTEARNLMFNALSRGTGATGNATDWFNLNMQTKVFTSTTDVYKAKPGSIIVWSGGTHGYGHVGFIEKVEYDSEGKAEYVWVTEGNPARCYYNKRTINYIKHYSNKNFVGYIYVVNDGG